MFRYSCWCLAATFLIGQPLHADERTTPSPEEQLASKVDMVFDALGMIAATPLPWVEVEFGPAEPNLKVQGWLVRDEPHRVAVFEGTGTLAIFRRPAPGELRQKSTSELTKGPYFLHSPESQVAWVVRPADLDRYCKKFLEKSVPDPLQTGPIVPVHYLADIELEETLICGCILSRDAQRRGNAPLSRALLARAVQSFHRMPLQPLLSKRDLEECFLDIYSQRQASSALNQARYGAPRLDLLLLWEVIAKLPADSVADKAKDLVDGYKSLIEEDNTWKEPKWFGSLTTEQKVAYWMYRLRDLDDFMYSDSVSSSSGRMNPRRVLNDFFLQKPPGAKINPAMELKKLGQAAMPTIIAHLDDTRPTRTGGLLRYGDCCQQIFEEITGYTIFKTRGGEEYPVELGQQKLCKQRAEKWWAEQQLRK